MRNKSHLALLAMAMVICVALFGMAAAALATGDDDGDDDDDGGQVECTSRSLHAAGRRDTWSAPLMS